jgi:serine/threonine-protein kinase
VADRYVIEQSVGQGGMGRVYRAYDQALHEPVAIKTLLPEFAADPAFLARFRDEVRLARRIAHENVCRVHDYVDHQGTPFLSMEWVEGETLASRLRRLGPRPEAELRVVFSDVVAALRALWSNGIVHRDLKPANLMWTRAGRVKVMDFGLARALLAEGMREKTSGIVGTPEYLSPEQIRGESATEKSDTYALGVTLFELATGRPPFRGDSPAQTAMKHLAEIPEASSLASISEELRSNILSFLEKNPAVRPDLRTRDGEATRIEPRPSVAPPSRMRGGAALLAGVGTVIALIVYLGIAGRSDRDTPASPSPAVSASPSPPLVTESPGTGPSPAPAPPANPVPSQTPTVASTPSPPGTPIAALPSPAPTPTGVSTPAPPIPTPAPVSPTPASLTAPSPVSPAAARIFVDVTPWAEVFVDGERKGETPLPPIVLPPGSHVVELRNPSFRSFFRTIELKAGQQSMLTVDLKLEGIKR